MMLQGRADGDLHDVWEVRWCMFGGFSFTLEADSCRLEYLTHITTYYFIGSLPTASEIISAISLFPCKMNLQLDLRALGISRSDN